MTNCTIEHCDKKIHGKGLCSYHYIKSRRTPTYNAFFQSKNRCTNPNNLRYKDYGGRGIKMCDRWSGVGGYKNFIEDMGERPDGMTLDRLDNNGNYEPSNCRWATYEQQNLNKRVYSNNKSGYVGVYWCNTNEWWVASMRTNGKHKTIGAFCNKQDAINARLGAELDREVMLKTVNN